MAIHLACDRQATINGIDLSQWATQVNVVGTSNTVDVTATQDTNKAMLSGKPTYTASVEFLANDDANTVSPTLAPLLGAAPFAAAFKPDKDTATEYAGNWILTRWEPIPNGTGDDAAKFVANFEASGNITRTA